MKSSSLKALWLFSFLYFSFFIQAQEQAPIQLENSQLNSNEPCDADQIHEHMMANDPEYMQRTIDFDNMMQNFVSNKAASTTYIIPLVVHVMETGNSLTDITDDEIRNSILALNERYRKIPGGLGDGNGVDVEIEFALAVRDPNGNCTDGIVRYDMTGNSTYMASGVYRSTIGIADASLKALSSPFISFISSQA